MIQLVVGLVIFLGIHSVSIVARPWRDAMVARLGAGTWKGLYSLVALLGLLMLPVFPLLFATYLPGRLKRWAKHPMLVAVKLWALAHLLANGMLADVLLFGSLLLWAVLDRISVKRRGEALSTAEGKILNDVLAIVLGLAVYGVFVMGGHLMLFGVSPFG
jgi:uncharacterized membrane protein